MSDVTTGRTPAYSITEVVEVLDPEGAQRYAELTPIAVDKFGGRFVVLGGLAHGRRGRGRGCGRGRRMARHGDPAGLVRLPGVRPGPGDRRDRHAPPAHLSARYRPDGLT